jgi:hypothetical protein
VRITNGVNRYFETGANNTIPVPQYPFPDKAAYIAIANSSFGGTNPQLIYTSNTGLLSTVTTTRYDYVKNSVKYDRICGSLYDISTSSSSFNIDCSLANVFKITLNNQITSITMSNASVAGNSVELKLYLVQNGSNSVTNWGSIIWTPSGSYPPFSGSNNTYIVRLETFDGGASWYGSYNNTVY